MNTTRKCFASGCQEFLPLDQLFCEHHTRMIPAEQAQGLRKAWDEGGVDGCKAMLFFVIGLIAEREQEEANQQQKGK